MATNPEKEGLGGEIVRKLAIPVAIAAAGSAAGFLLKNKDKLGEAAPKLRETVSDLPTPHVPEVAGELTGDLKGKLDEVLGKAPTPAAVAGDGPDRSELRQRRRQRQERRNRRRQRGRR